MKSAVAPTLANVPGYDPIGTWGGAWLMSLTSVVPAAVPSVFHSSLPFADVKAEKKSVEPMTVAPTPLSPA